MCVAQDARRNNLYSTVFRNNKRISSYLLGGIEELFATIKKISKNKVPLYFYGDIVSLYKEEIRKKE